MKLVEPKHPALHKKADINPFDLDVDLDAREKEMIALMKEKYGLGLASPQIGESVGSNRRTPYHRLEQSNHGHQG